MKKNICWKCGSREMSQPERNPFCSARCAERWTQRQKALLNIYDHGDTMNVVRQTGDIDRNSYTPDFHDHPEWKRHLLSRAILDRLPVSIESDRRERAVMNSIGK
jgi:endogenous inhibitor of DNA gyrase (YacG/DUF329 family)